MVPFESLDFRFREIWDLREIIKLQRLALGTSPSLESLRDLLLVPQIGGRVKVGAEHLVWQVTLAYEMTIVIVGVVVVGSMSKCGCISI